MIAHLLPAILLTTGVGAAMMRLGMRNGLLNARLQSRRCASCSRRIEGWHCPSCSRR